MGVVRTLHSGGNYRDLHALAEEPYVDAIEADVWVVRGHIVAQHNRPLGWLPVSLYKDGLHISLDPPIELDELLLAIQGHCALVLDLRAWWADPVPAVVERLTEAPERTSHVRATCESWAIADRLRSWLPNLPVAYSVRSELQLRDYVRGCINGSRPPVAIAIRHTLLHDETEVAALRQFTPRIAAWTVDDVDRALQLASWGIDEIVSNSPDVLRAL